MRCRCALLPGVLGFLAGFVLAAVAYAAPVAVTVTPAVGVPLSVFAVSFAAPVRIGEAGSSDITIMVSATHTGTGGGKCQSGFALQAADADAGAYVQVLAVPSGRWCTGLYQGSLRETQMPLCRRGHACPLYVLAPRVIGGFTFRVKASAGTPTPVFAGLQSAPSCSGGLQRAGQGVSFNLRWLAARTPAGGAVVHDIFQASATGQENYRQPSWTTATTSFRTPILAAGQHFFVVRARETNSGLEDRNTRQQRGENVCL